MRLCDILLLQRAVVEVIQRSSFCANEIEIFEAAVRWSEKNEETNISEIINKIRFPLVSITSERL